jgi:hypothetical protein
VVVDTADEDDEETASLQLKVTELDGRRAASILVRRTDGEQLGTPVESA